MAKLTAVPNGAITLLTEERLLLWKYSLFWGMKNKLVDKWEISHLPSPLCARHGTQSQSWTIWCLQSKRNVRPPSATGTQAAFKTLKQAFNQDSSCWSLKNSISSKIVTPSKDKIPFFFFRRSKYVPVNSQWTTQTSDPLLFFFFFFLKNWVVEFSWKKQIKGLKKCNG